MSYWVAGAAVVGAVGGSLISKNASKGAANAQAGAAQNATELEQQEYDQTRTDNLPALNARNASLDRLQSLLGIGGDKNAPGYGSLGGSINPSDVQNSAGYQFGLKQGQTTLNNQEVARGMSNSGQALKAAAQYGTDYATTKYDDAFNREIANRNQQLNGLQSVAGLGQTGANTISSAGSNYANQAGQNIIGAGNAQAAAGISQGNAITGAINQGVGWYSANRPSTTPSYVAPTQFQSGTTFYGGGDTNAYGGTNLYGDGFGPI